MEKWTIAHLLMPISQIGYSIRLADSGAMTAAHLPMKADE
jgi:hypothetical protein